jgi:ribosomal protein S18 acetylase RimI-like enzyme
VILRKAAGRDIAAILQIQSESGAASSWRAEDYLAYVCTVAEIDGQVAGYLLARQVAESEFEILHVAVAREFRRRGVALSLIRVQLAESKGDWFLEVRASNTAARSLYEKARFMNIGVREGYYCDPPEHGIVMRIRSC